MAFIVRKAAQLSRPEGARKLIKAADFWTFRKAEEALADAMRRRDEIIAAAQDAYEAERRRGYEDGLEAAKREQATHMTEIVGQAVNYFSTVEQRMVDLVFDAVRKIVMQFDDRTRAATVVHAALEAVRNQRQLTVRVHPDRVDAVRADLDTMLQAFPAIQCVDVTGDARLAVDACAVESDIGVVEASIASQLESMKEAFTRAFRPSS